MKRVWEGKTEGRWTKEALKEEKDSRVEEKEIKIDREWLKQTSGWEVREQGREIVSVYMYVCARWGGLYGSMHGQVWTDGSLCHLVMVHSNSRGKNQDSRKKHFFFPKLELTLCSFSTLFRVKQLQLFKYFQPFVCSSLSWFCCNSRSIENVLKRGNPGIFIIISFLFKHLLKN